MYKLPVLIVSFLAVSFLLFSGCESTTNSSSSGLIFEIPHPEIFGDTTVDGRIFVMISTDAEKEPRFDISDGPNTQQIFGMDVENWEAGTTIQLTKEVDGYPLTAVNELEMGDYYVQVLFHRYETFQLKTGHTVKLPMDRGEGQQWNQAPGNLYSKPEKMHLDPSKSYSLSIPLTEKIPPIEPAEDTPYIKHVRIKSKLLTEFWGRPMYLGAHVLLPEGFDTHPEVKYPLAIMHGHFPHDFGGFSTTPPDPDLAPIYSARFQLEGYNKIVEEHAYQFYKEWSGPNFPRVLAIKIQHANPYYDDSYAVNSENLGPYGDAITYELIPYIEEQFRGIGEGWARFVYGGSTGGWEALAVQVKYPDEYNSCYAACPDPIDFRAYCLVNLYEDPNAYYREGTFRKTEIPGHRDYLGDVQSTLKGMNQRELALGSRSRSGQQWDIWEAVYSPMGPDGYPQRIWDKKTGEINKEVASYWKENFDLAYILKRDWKTLGPKLKGKINIYCGDMDNYYLNNAVYLTEEILENTTDPYYDGEVDYGDRAEHCWNGDHTRSNALSRLRYHQMFIPKWAEWVKTHAPQGADLKSWRY